jgi:hypothetical protein
MRSSCFVKSYHTLVTPSFYSFTAFSDSPERTVLINTNEVPRQMPCLTISLNYLPTPDLKSPSITKVLDLK